MGIFYYIMSMDQTSAVIFWINQCLKILTESLFILENNWVGHIHCQLDTVPNIMFIIDYCQLEINFYCFF